MTEEQALELARKLNAMYAEAELDDVQIAAVQEIASNVRVLMTWGSSEVRANAS